MSRIVMRSWPLLVAILLGSGSTAAAETPTYNRDVAPILNAKCINCHRPEQVAPMSLLSYREVRPWARAIKAKVASREMPPWQADRQIGTFKFSNDWSLSDAEIAKITAWADASAPEGTGTAPPLPKFSTSKWNHPSGREPDFVYEFPVDVHLPASGEMPNINAYTPFSFNGTRLIEMVETRPGNYRATHHITARAATLPPGMKLGRGTLWAGGPALDCDCMLVPDSAPAAKVPEESEEARRERQVNGGGFVGGNYVPGRTPQVYPGQVSELRGDQVKYIVWNLHYQATGEPETARPAIGFWFAKETPDHTVVSRSVGLREYTSEGKVLIAPLGTDPRTIASRKTGQIQDSNLLLAPIPPHAANWTVTGIGALQNDAALSSIMIHAHLRGKDFTLLLTDPDGREEILMRVPKYAFDWQFVYELAEPRVVRAGSTIKAIARYDNSTANKFNPAPNKEVYWSEQSWDDMFTILVSYTTTEAPAAPTTAQRSAAAN